MRGSTRPRRSAARNSPRARLAPLPDERGRPLCGRRAGNRAGCGRGTPHRAGRHRTGAGLALASRSLPATSIAVPEPTHDAEHALRAVARQQPRWDRERSWARPPGRGMAGVDRAGTAMRRRQRDVRTPSVPAGVLVGARYLARTPYKGVYAFISTSRTGPAWIGEQFFSGSARSRAARRSAASSRPGRRATSSIRSCRRSRAASGPRSSTKVTVTS